MMKKGGCERTPRVIKLGIAYYLEKCLGKSSLNLFFEMLMLFFAVRLLPALGMMLHTFLALSVPHASLLGAIARVHSIFKHYGTNLFQ